MDCSDHEVNLKILLSQRELAGELTRKQRDRLLASLTDQVATLVLANNDRQAGALALASFEAQRSAMEAGRLIHWLTRQGELNPELEFIRTDSQALTRPELAVLMATEKNRLKRALVGLDQSPALAKLAQDAFPPAVRENFADEIKRHRLALNSSPLKWRMLWCIIWGLQFLIDLNNCLGPAQSLLPKPFRWFEWFLSWTRNGMKSKPCPAK